MHRNAAVPKERVQLGFTLIELLVVIAIVAILAAILFPVFARAKLTAKRTVDLAHIKQIGYANLIYLQDFDSSFLAFPFAEAWSVPAYSGRQKGPFWTDRLMPYTKSTQIFAAAPNTDRVTYPRGYWLPGAKSASDTAASPGIYRVTYALNHLISHADLNPDRPGAAVETSVERPAETVLLGPQQQPFGYSTCVADSADSQVMHFAWTISDPEFGYGYELFGSRKLEGGFGGGANFGFVDGHARFARTEDRGTAPGDLAGYFGRDLFLGTFQRIYTRMEVSTDGTCPAFRGDAAF